MADIIMDKMDIVTQNKPGLGILAVDGLIYGLVSGVAMVLGLAAMALFSEGGPGTLLARFNADGLTSPVLGLMSHLAVSAIYGLLYGVLVWPILRRITPVPASAWIGGLLYAGFLFLLAQIAILPGTNSPLGQIPSWEWAVGHVIYGLVLGGLFARKVA